MSYSDVIKDQKDEAVYVEAYRQEILSDFYFAAKYFHYLLDGEDFIENWHHIVEAEYLVQVFLGHIKNLKINIPPGYTKTRMMIYFTAWCYAHFAACKFIHSSYRDKLVTRNSGDIQRLLRTNYKTTKRNKKGKEIPVFGYSVLFPEVEISTSSAGKVYWETSRGGAFLAQAFGEGMTGYHAGQMYAQSVDDIFKFTGAYLLDDPNKPQEMRYKNYRDTVIDTYINAISSRPVTRNVPKILIMQRLHEEDLSGYIEEKESDSWTHLKLPALLKRKMIWSFSSKEQNKDFEEGNTNGDDDVALWPYKHTVDELYIMKNAQDLRTRTMFAGQYQQEPAPSEGGIFKADITRWQVLPPTYDFDFTVTDTAQNTQDTNDYTVHGYFQKYGHVLYFADMERGRFPIDESKDKLIQMNDNWEPSQLHIELQANGRALMQLIKAERFLPLFEFDAKKHGDKRVRAEAASVFWNSNYIQPPYLLDWGPVVVEEMKNFPNATHDDIVDVVSMASLVARLTLNLHTPYSTDLHLKERINFQPSHMVMSWNCQQLPCCILAEVTAHNQLRILDVDFKQHQAMPIEQYVASVVHKHRLFLSKTQPLTVNLITNAPTTTKFEKDGSNIYNFNDILYSNYRLYPQVDQRALKGSALNYNVEIANNIMLSNIINAESRPEPQMVVSRNAKLVDKALSGGIALDKYKSKMDDPNSWELEKVSPYFEIAQCFYNLVYYYFMKRQNDMHVMQQTKGDAITGKSQLDIGAIY